MAKELLLYSPIYDWTAERLVDALEVNKDEEITLRINSGGGSVYAGYSILTKLQEHKGSVKIKVDGIAASMASFMLAFFDDIEALDVSEIMIHRADTYIDSPETQSWLDGTNAKLRSKLEAKINVDKLKKLKGVTMDQIFDPTQRLNVFLTADEAKKIGLISRVKKLTPVEATAYFDVFSAAASIDPENKPAGPSSKPTENKPANFSKMTIDKLKAEHPDVYNQVFALGQAAEKDRVEACLVWVEIDPKATKEAIESGKPLSQKQLSEFHLKAISANALSEIEGGNPKPVATPEADATAKTEKEKSVEAFESSLNAHLKISK